MTSKSKLSDKPEGVTIKMKALDKLMVLLMLVLKKDHFLAVFIGHKK